MKTFVLKLRTLVFGAVTGGVADARPVLKDHLADLRKDAAKAVRAGVQDALAELHGLLDDELVVMPKVPAEANGKSQRNRLAVARRR
jgi:hypothetical protein